MVGMNHQSCYDENFFYGSEKKKGLTYFPGKVKSVKKQLSGNQIITLVNKKEEKLINKDVIIKQVEIEKYNLEEILEVGNIISVYGISTKRNTIFPVCILKMKKEKEIEVIEIEE
ncbi:MAG: hypothetical protein ACFFCS_10870, partial [Candidatus Hodarchaeota archaeon]